MGKIKPASLEEKRMENVKLVKIRDLIGKPVDGVLADLHSRFPDGALMYEHTAKEKRTARMKRVYIKREDGHKWLRWEWHTEGFSLPFSCGFSGIRMDRDDVDQYCILIEGGSSNDGN